MYISGNKPQSEMTASPSKYPQGYFNEKLCRECRAPYSPQAPSHLYCSQGCHDIGFMRNYLRKTYDISYEYYHEMHESQNKRCRICLGEGFTMARNQKLKLVVDHCHKTGVVRGMLCHNCNRGLGLFQDDIGTLQRAIDYLKSATTIPEGSTHEANACGSAQPS